jgi:plasmid replication initiation protein
MSYPIEDAGIEALLVNTQETLGVTPRFVLQYNAISRSIQNLSATAKKLTVMAMALLPTDLSSRTARFTFGEFCKALGVSIGGESFRLFKDAATECMENIITVETDKIIKGKRKWEKYVWFSHSSFDEESGICTMTFAEEFAGILKEMRRVYAKINLKDLGKLQSRYAIRYYEMAKSYESLAGKDGNQSGTWYFERTIPELRQLLAIPESAYPRTNTFREKVVEGPVKELNEAGVGLAITPEGIKQGRNLKSIRFNCNKATRPLTAKRGRGRPKKNQAPDEQLTLPELSPQTREEKELEHMAELHPLEFAELYADELAAQKKRYGKSISPSGAQISAQAKLKKKYGIQK